MLFTPALSATQKKYNTRFAISTEKYNHHLLKYSLNIQASSQMVVSVGIGRNAGKGLTKN
jgi:hypothetical protein